MLSAPPRSAAEPQPIMFASAKMWCGPYEQSGVWACCRTFAHRALRRADEWPLLGATVKLNLMFPRSEPFLPTKFKHGDCRIQLLDRLQLDFLLQPSA